MKKGQVGDAEDGYPLRQSQIAWFQLFNHRLYLGMQSGTVPVFVTKGQLSPQISLPDLITRRYLVSFFPCKYHVRSENQILVEQIGDLPRQLHLFDLTVIIDKIRPQTGIRRSIQTPGKYFHNTKRQNLRVKDIFRSGFNGEFFAKIMQKCIGKRIIRVGTDVVTGCQLHGDPSGHTGALCDDDFFFKNRRQGPA